MQIYLLGDVQVEERADVIRFSSQELESGFVITGGFELFYEVHREPDELGDVFVPPGIDDLPVNLVKIAGF